MVTHHVHSAFSGDLKRAGDNKLEQVSIAKELLKLGSSPEYKLNSSLKELEHLHGGPLCQHKEDFSADI